MTISTSPFISGILTSGRIPIVSVSGSIASPIATLTGTTGAAFTLPAAIKIPAGSIVKNSRVCVSMHIKRSGANATGLCEVLLGTSNTTSDSLLGRTTINATDGHVGWVFACGLFGTSNTSFISTGTSAPQSSSAGAATLDRSTNINTAADMYINLGMSSTNALDTFNLLAYTVWLEY